MTKNQSSFDDSRDDHYIGVKKNKSTNDRVGPQSTPEFNISSGWPEENYRGDVVDEENPSYEGEEWFSSKSFNDEETNKRPLHPTKDYLNIFDGYSGDDHLEKGNANYKPIHKNKFKDSVGSENYYHMGGDEQIKPYTQYPIEKENSEYPKKYLKDNNMTNTYISEIEIKKALKKVIKETMESKGKKQYVVEGMDITDEDEETVNDTLPLDDMDFELSNSDYDELVWNYKGPVRSFRGSIYYDGIVPETDDRDYDRKLALAILDYERKKMGNSETYVGGVGFKNRGNLIEPFDNMDF